MKSNQKPKQNIQKFFGGKLQNVRVQTVCNRRSTARRRTSKRYSGFEETDSTLETENDDSEGDGQDQGDETRVNAS